MGTTVKRLRTGWLGLGLWGVLVACLLCPASHAAEDSGAGIVGTAVEDGPSASSNPGEAQPAIAEHHRSPRGVMFTFLDGINRPDRNGELWDEVLGCLDLSRVNAERGKGLAVKLLGVLNRLGQVRSYELPGPQQVAVDGLSSFTYFPTPGVHQWVFEKVQPRGGIVIEKDNQGRWRFSAETLAGLDKLYESLESLPIRHGVDERGLSLPLWIESKVPASLKHREVLSLKYWQWIGLLALILVGVVVDHVLRLFLRLVSHRLIARQQGSAKHSTVTDAVRPLGLLCAGLLWLVLIRVLGLPDSALTVLLASIRLFTVLAGTWAAWRVTDLVCEVLASKASHTETKIDDVLVPLVRKTVKIFVVAFGLIYAAQALNIPILPMLTSLGIGGLAFAFAAKDTVENFFGSVAVVLDRPFEVGDWVVMAGVEGTVEEVGFRSTRVRTFYNSQVTVPNATLVRATVDNLGRREYRRLKTHLGIQYDTPAEKIVAFTEGIRELIRTHPYTRKDYFQVWLHEFGASSLNVLLYVFFRVPDWATELRERERLFLDIIRLADQLGVQFAFPTQTLHVFQEDASAPHNPAVVPGAQTHREAELNGVRTAQRVTSQQPWLGQQPEAVQFSQGPTRLGGESDGGG